ncbi:MAG: NAD(P)-dependent oxidoreductase [Lachnospiraceae bacterium]|uniref:NAD(P)-dependent oxidoreductase n=2 Tax=Lachnospiraceae TaxID=186803 RepID=A0A9D2TE69_9FIRM|nr:NAD(P)-dependent oxidoreductase [Lachnospiraceae bacterium]HIR05616.1 NAD(P)-dependent oxidoreductase [Candidatus Copromonas faecavium]HJC65262.1 NAD(P)-dependent oxidoreductase [Candidatus Enterocloster excrementigallinarum]
MAVHVIDEANRCLQCKKPMCQQGCPIHTSIPVMIKALKEGRLEEAAAMLFENNPMSLVCSLVCNHENQCEGHCVLGRKGQPVHISSIENYISDTCFERIKVECEPKNGKKVAVIGAGPAGITIAIMLTKKGYSVTIFDSRDKIGGVLQYGIPEFRLPKTILQRYKKKLLEIGIKIRPNTTIGGALEIKDLFRDGYESIFIGTGVWRPKTLGVKGESLGNVHFAIDYLANPDAYDLGNRVAIIGVGNSAMDVARTVIRHGSHDVTLYARGDHSDASQHETSYAMLDGAKFEYNMSIVEINDDGPVFRHVYRDEEGKVTGYSEETEQVYADSTIISISQGPKSKLVNTTKGLKATQSGLLETDENGETTVEGIFASGDVVLGAKTVVQAVAYSKKVAEAMDAYMKSKDEKNQENRQNSEVE